MPAEANPHRFPRRRGHLQNSYVPAGATIDAPALSTPLLHSGTAYLQHNVSDTGQVFFDTPDALVPTDTNGEPDVYEYESGNVRLLSSGTSVDPSLFADATPNGSDAFFMTSSQLVPQDTDGAMDVYDARVGDRRRAETDWCAARSPA